MLPNRCASPIVRVLTLIVLLACTLVPGTTMAVPTGVVSGVDVARIAGVEEAVGRAFDSYETSRSSGIGHLEVAVLAFADSEAAQAGLSQVFPALTSVLRQDARSADPPALGDEALAWNASGPGNLDVAILIVRNDAHVHLFTAVAESGDPLAELEGIASRTVGREPGATPSASPASPEARPLTSGGLWDLLPRYEDLPGDFGLYTEESWPVAEPPGVPPVPTAADCQVEPRPRSDFEQSVSTTASPQPIGTPGTAATPAAGDPADAGTTEAVTATMHEYLTCLALGDWPRAYALVTDRYLHEQLPELTPEIIDFLFSGDAMPPVAEGPRLAEVRDVQVLPDGRIFAVAESVTLFEQEQREVAHVWLVREGDRYLIDNIVPIE